MTTLNTIIEEEKKEAEKLTSMVVRMMQGAYNSNDARIADVRRAITTAMQRAYEAGQVGRDTYWKERVRKLIWDMDDRIDAGDSWQDVRKKMLDNLK